MENEIKSWLSATLKENIENHSVRVLGNSEKGDGFMSDILFVTLIPAEQGQKYELVLKCTKNSQAFRTATPIKEAFKSEIHIYSKIFPEFTKFQLELGLQDSFNSFPTCYGTFTENGVQVIVLENMKSKSYTMWEKKKPLTKKHIDLIIEEYAKFHSISFAMLEKDSRKFEQLCSGLGATLHEFIKAHHFDAIFSECVAEIGHLLRGDLDDRTLDIWQTLKDQAGFILDDMIEMIEGPKIILHASCWCNNFMFKYDNNDNDLPVSVSILDWQMSRAASPILELSYLIFTCISGEDLHQINNILSNYYQKLKLYSSRFGTNLEQLYSEKQLQDDWKKYARFGILYASGIYKVCVTEKDEVLDAGQVTEEGKNLSETFSYDVKNKTALKNRARNMVKYVVENGLI